MNIIVYTKRGCHWCKEVVNYLDEKKVQYENREVLSNELYYKELIEKSGQKKTPTLDIDGFILADSDKEQVEKYLNEYGKRNNQ
jgi:glutaredoxin